MPPVAAAALLTVVACPGSWVDAPDVPGFRVGVLIPSTLIVSFVAMFFVFLWVKVIKVIKVIKVNLSSCQIVKLSICQ